MPLLPGIAYCVVFLRPLLKLEKKSRRMFVQSFTQYYWLQSKLVQRCLLFQSSYFQIITNGTCDPGQSWFAWHRGIWLGNALVQADFTQIPSNARGGSHTLVQSQSRNSLNVYGGYQFWWYLCGPPSLVWWASSSLVWWGAIVWSDYTPYHTPPSSFNCSSSSS